MSQFGYSPIIRGNNKPDQFGKNLGTISDLTNDIVKGRSKAFLTDAISGMDDFMLSYDPMSSDNFGTSASDAFEAKASSLLNDTFISEEDAGKYRQFLNLQKAGFVKRVRSDVVKNANTAMRKSINGSMVSALKSIRQYPTGFNTDKVWDNLEAQASLFFPADMPKDLRKQSIDSLKEDFFNAVRTGNDVASASKGKSSMRGLPFAASNGAVSKAVSDSIGSQVSNDEADKVAADSMTKDELSAAAASGNKHAQDNFVRSRGNRIVALINPGSTPEERKDNASEERLNTDGSVRYPFYRIENDTNYHSNVAFIKRHGMDDQYSISTISKAFQNHSAIGLNSDLALARVGSLASILVSRGKGFNFEDVTNSEGNSAKSHVLLMAVAADIYNRGDASSMSEALSMVKTKAGETRDAVALADRFKTSWDERTKGIVGIGKGSPISKFIQEGDSSFFWRRWVHIR